MAVEAEPQLTRYQVRDTLKFNFTMLLVGVSALFAAIVTIIVCLAASPVVLAGMALPGSFGLKLATELYGIRQHVTTRIMREITRKAMGG